MDDADLIATMEAAAAAYVIIAGQHGAPVVTESEIQGRLLATLTFVAKMARLSGPMVKLCVEKTIRH